MGISLFDSAELPQKLLLQQQAKQKQAVSKDLLCFVITSEDKSTYSISFYNINHVCERFD